MTRLAHAPSDFLPPEFSLFERKEHRGFVSLFLLLFALSCFFPYPALAIGNYNGLQLGEALALLALPFVLFRPPTRALAIYVLYFIPITLSALISMMSVSWNSSDIMLKEMLSTVIAVTVLTLSTRLVDDDLPRKVLSMAAAAILFHVGVGILQIYKFNNNEFPLLFLYKNPSFKPLESWAEVYATYMKRPCGLFPEPSAMTSSIGPWLILICGVLFNAEARHRLAPSRFSRALLGASLAGGLLLVGVSRSGLAPAILAGAVIVVAAQWKSSGLQGNPVAKVLGGLAALVAFLGLAFVVWKLQAGFEARFESSWGLRSASIITALTANNEPLTFLFGVGPGQASVVIRRLLAGMPIPDGEAEMSLWSVSVAYYMDTGLLGAISLCTMAVVSLRAVMRSSAKLLGIVAMGIWWVGITVITSYVHLSAIWLFFGFLLEWERIFPPLRANSQEPPIEAVEPSALARGRAFTSTTRPAPRSAN